MQRDLLEPDRGSMRVLTPSTSFIIVNQDHNIFQASGEVSEKFEHFHIVGTYRCPLKSPLTETFLNVIEKTLSYLREGTRVYLIGHGSDDLGTSSPERENISDY